MSSIMPLNASNIRRVNSSSFEVAIIRDVGRSSAELRAVSSALSFSQSALLRPDSGK
jgi:hypothetical protein